MEIYLILFQGTTIHLYTAIHVYIQGSVHPSQLYSLCYYDFTYKNYGKKIIEIVVSGCFF